ncbi:phage minor head protein [Hymenobacter mucosus]|uniref:Phage Mu protein F like protein n=1 Tax=Hymenobacter mucosus TaxID=1411120 RepID=A0A239AAZ3_9BACT|nr:phage minor head protein [Hymenobacter mucosus]SNR92228.1 Phage Mu protein F like protein [Hymenobacter mucosus]
MPTDTPEARIARLDAYESRFIPKLAAALIKSVEPAISAYEQGATPSLAAAYVKDTHVGTVLEQLYRTVAVDEAKRTYDTLTEGQKAQAPGTLADGWVARARDFLRGEGRMTLQGITERTQGVVRDVLEAAQELGLSIPDAARRLRQTVTGIARERAIAICRTEINASSNAGSLWGAQATGLALQKQWLDTKDGRARPTHVAANGQKAPLDGFFSVGQGRGRYPGDPLLPVGERARCRCTQTYVPID